VKILTTFKFLGDDDRKQAVRGALAAGWGIDDIAVAAGVPRNVIHRLAERLKSDPPKSIAEISAKVAKAREERPAPVVIEAAPIPARLFPRRPAPEATPAAEAVEPERKPRRLPGGPASYRRGGEEEGFEDMLAVGPHAAVNRTSVVKLGLLGSVVSPLSPEG
jgi:hypothetical protein